ncbi:hypothetical protein JTB14_010256 [Gonioctena quinquepunctata]|nr:hypothetical protein JTB14_010256 [Gonioctena quinquepunctata]
MEAAYNKAYGTATYVRRNIENACLKLASSTDSVFEIVVQLGNISINNIYEPPNNQWPPQVVQSLAHPGLYIGDFNSYHELWNYKRSDENGQHLVRWAEHNDAHLLFDIKDHGTFRLAA